MAEKNFAEIMRRILVHEGGKVDDPKDPGGRTNQGVTQGVYAAYCAQIGLPVRDVFDMRPAERDEIYRRQYWNMVKGDRLPPGVDYAVMDAAVHSGPTRSAQWLQRAVGAKVDGHIGEATLEAVASHPDHDALVAALCARRLAFCRALPTWRRFGNGWTARIQNVEKVGQAWATGSVGPAPVLPFGAIGVKATMNGEIPLPSVAKGIAAVGTGATVLSTLNDLQNALAPLQGMIPAIDTLIYGFGAVAAIVTAGGALYALYAKVRRKEVSDALDLPVAA